MAYGIDDFVETQYRTAAAINPRGSLILYQRTRFDLKSEKNQKCICIMDVSDAPREREVVVDDDASEPTWISDDQFLYFKSAKSQSEAAGEDGKKVETEVTELWKHDFRSTRNTKLHTFDGPVANMKFHKSGRLAFSATVDRHSDATFITAEQAKDDQKVLAYDEVWVRHWDSWIDTRRKQTIFVTKPLLGKALEAGSDGDAEDFKLEPPRNVLQGHPHESPVPAFGDTGDFSMAEDSIAFLAKDPDLNPALHSTSNIYLASATGTGDGYGEPRKINHTKGASANPRFSKSGRKLLYLEMRRPGYEADRNHVMVYDTTRYSTTELDLPEKCTVLSADWGADDGTIYVNLQIDNYAGYYRCDLAKKSCKPVREYGTPKAGSDDAIAVADSGDVVLSGSSLTHPRHYIHLPGGDGGATARNLFFKETIGLDPKRVKQIFTKRNGRTIPSILTLPADFDEAKQYPTILLVHGGPQGAWTMAWSKRWNSALMSAAGGCITVSVNPTGSTGQGQAFTDEICCHWGSRPYDDLWAAWLDAKKQFPQIDPEKCAAAGASYGGYMMNWFQGHAFGRAMRALVCHCGIFDTKNVYFETDELYFPEQDLSGPPFAVDGRPSAADVYDRNNPAKFVEKWRTPQLVIHNERDYRLPVTEGLSAFTALQRQGVKSRLVVFKEENHWVLKPLNSKRWCTEVLAWIQNALDAMPYDEFDPSVEPDWQTEAAGSVDEVRL